MGGVLYVPTDEPDARRAGAVGAGRCSCGSGCTAISLSYSVLSSTSSVSESSVDGVEGGSGPYAGFGTGGSAGTAREDSASTTGCERRSDAAAVAAAGGAAGEALGAKASKGCMGGIPGGRVGGIPDGGMGLPGRSLDALEGFAPVQLRGAEQCRFGGGADSSGSESSSRSTGTMPVRTAGERVGAASGASWDRGV